MPELPEVETMRRGVLPIVGCSVRKVVLPKSRLRPIQVTPRGAAFRRRVVGRGIVSVGRVGKRVVIQLDSGDRIVRLVQAGRSTFYCPVCQRGSRVALSEAER